MAEILRGASAEMAEAADWYSERVNGLGERFLLETESTFARIEKAPLTGAPWVHRRLPDGVRRMFLRSLPYAVVYCRPEAAASSTTTNALSEPIERPASVCL